MKDGYELAKQIWIEAKKLTAAGYGGIRIVREVEKDAEEQNAKTRGEVVSSEE